MLLCLIWILIGNETQLHSFQPLIELQTHASHNIMSIRYSASVIMLMQLQPKAETGTGRKFSFRFKGNGVKLLQIFTIS
jgi:hypothetical protein